ncbi:MAG: NAD(P)/FAD-dependent oxidoreductase [Xanthobacteraceae bacterium]|nr:MAG: NAD(P)/FAD-dependent oxidoreductase [Xanthobacteraceae bacterium]
MAKTYDLVVIGTGTAASVAASRCRAAGWRVAVIDHLPFGGTCALRGCDPKKVLVGAAEAIDHVHRMRGKGVAGGEPAIDWRALIHFKRSFTEPVPSTKEESFAKSGIDAFHGRARFTGPRTVAVEGAELDGRFVLIATGAVPMRLGIAGEEHLATSTDFLELDELPKRIALLGGGFISAEFAHLASRAGAQVTVLEQVDRMLTQFDPDLVGWLMEKTRQLGIDIQLGVRVEAIEKTGAAFKVHARSGGTSRTVEADLVVHAAGRVPDLEPLDLPAASVEVSGGRLQLNEFLQSISNPAVYAAGDAAASGPPLTPVASHDAKIVAANMLHGNHQKPNYLGVPSVVFTIPPLARVGMLEAEARRQGLRFRMQHQKTSSWNTARRVGEEASGFKVLVEEDTDRILGAHLLGPHAEEVITLFGLAIRSGLTAETVKGMISGYPSACSDIGYML